MISENLVGAMNFLPDDNLNKRNLAALFSRLFCVDLNIKPVKLL
jgi:hypothetical protein